MSSIIPLNKGGVFQAAKYPSFTNMLDDFFNDRWAFGGSLAGDTFKMDLRDCGNEYCVEAELPGVKKEEVGLSIDEGRLTVSVKKREEKEESSQGYIHRERRSSSMSRSVYLPDVASEGVSAKLEDGILTIALPKTTPVETKREIEIQ